MSFLPKFAGFWDCMWTNACFALKTDCLPACNQSMLKHGQHKTRRLLKKKVCIFIFICRICLGSLACYTKQSALISVCRIQDFTTKQNKVEECFVTSLKISCFPLLKFLFPCCGPVCKNLPQRHFPACKLHVDEYSAYAALPPVDVASQWAQG